MKKTLMAAIISSISVMIFGQTTVRVLGNESMLFNGVVNGANSGLTVEILTEAQNYGAPRFEFQLDVPWARAQLMIQEAGTSPTAIIPFTRIPSKEPSYTWIALLCPNRP